MTDRNHPDFPSIMRTDDDARGLEAYLDEQRARRQAQYDANERPALWITRLIVIGLVVALAVMAATIGVTP